MFKHSYFLLTVLVIVFLMSGCSQPSPDKNIEIGTGSEDASQVNRESGRGTQVEVDAIGHVMHVHTHTEEHFIREMIPHHQEAVDSSRAIYSTTENELLKALADHIIIYQEKEIEIMNEWLEEWYPDSRYNVTYHSMMPTLYGLSQQELETAYIEGMIAHHEMAVDMSKEVLLFDSQHIHPEVRILAQSIMTVQEREINLMKEILANSTK